MKDRGDCRNTVVGADAVLEGSFSIEGDLRVEGILHGSRLSAKERLIVGKSGEVKAQSIEVEEAVISGSVSGVLSARRQIRLEAGARFRGILKTPRLVIEDGAELQEDRDVEGGDAEEDRKEDSGE